jgi:hypothetical protein
MIATIEQQAQMIRFHLPILAILAFMAINSPLSAAYRSHRHGQPAIGSAGERHEIFVVHH